MKLSPKTSLWVAGGLLLVLTLVKVGLHYFRQANAREAELAAANHTLGSLRAELAALEQKAGATEKAAVDRRREQARAVERQRSPRPPKMSFATRALQNPALAKPGYLPLIRKYFGSFHGAAGLTPAQVEQLEAWPELGAALELFLLAMPTGELPDPATAVQIEAGTVDYLVDEARAKFDEAVAAKFAEVLRTRDLRRAVDAFAVRTHAIEAPVTAAQSQQLFELLGEAGAAPLGAGLPVTLHALDWDKVMQRAPSVLSAAQLRALEAMRARALFDREYERITGFSAEARLPEPER